MQSCFLIDLQFELLQALWAYGDLFIILLQSHHLEVYIYKTTK